MESSFSCKLEIALSLKRKSCAHFFPVSFLQARAPSHPLLEVTAQHLVSYAVR